MFGSATRFSWLRATEFNYLFWGEADERQIVSFALEPHAYNVDCLGKVIFYILLRGSRDRGLHRLSLVVEDGTMAFYSSRCGHMVGILYRAGPIASAGSRTTSSQGRDFQREKVGQHRNVTQEGVLPRLLQHESSGYRLSTTTDHSSLMLSKPVLRTFEIDYAAHAAPCLLFAQARRPRIPLYDGLHIAVTPLLFNIRPRSFLPPAPTTLLAQVLL
ncbi:hypothetical protein GALMADRAFT_222713 [Galerina marginata CBS 339.88]|uniref:Uncharacterized protein n=1 Tax=Galerina marginata (strain CBS 339.88) TaxID=685588 RepID=A0A067TQG9_GALM3|nr:hypothetical protein GALMADRAFT_222713 [Galerina marginata CBS 339.88]